MKRNWKKITSLFLSVLLFWSLAGTSVRAEEKKAAPTEVTNCEASGWSTTILGLGFADIDWMNAISSVTVNEEEYKKQAISNWGSDTNIWNIGDVSGAYGSYKALKLALPADVKFPLTVKVSADGYHELTVEVVKETVKYQDVYTATVKQEKTGESTDTDVEKDSDGTVELSQVSIGTDYFKNNWELTFSNASDYVNAVTDVKVNGISWSKVDYSVSSGGQYKKDIDNNKLVFAAKDFISNPEITALKSGDVVTIMAKGYEDLTFKLVIDNNGKASLVKDDGEGDPYELHVKIAGSFEAAVAGQKDYDGVSSASIGGASSNNNSAVKVYGALVKKGEDVKDTDWEELDHSSKISLNGSKCSVSIMPDAENGTPANSESGMKGVYMTLSSDLTLDGTPKDAGSYLISVTITDDQGRSAVSNTLPFRIYSGDEKLAEQLKEENLKKYSSGLYAWDIMEPWTIHNFGSNVSGEDESVRVPKDLEAWFGSHESGTYGFLGYDIPWSQVTSGDIPQTLYIPKGCNLTLTNMKVLSSVHVVVENGGKLTLSDSVVQGIIDVQSGGTFSMNYDSFNEKFTTGASLCGQLRLADGATVENAAIYSNANYLANGNLTDRTTSEPVVVVNGNVNVKGQVFVKGDSAGGEIGQTALRVSNGTLKLVDGVQLVTYGGDGTVVLYADGGTAIELDNGRIEGNGTVVAIGGSVLWGNGGNAVTGIGSIAVNKAFLQGATANTSKNATPGKAVSDGIKVISSSTHIADGTMISGAENDPLENLYWKASIDPAPSFDNYITVDNENAGNGENTGNNENTGNGENTGNNENTGNSENTGNNENTGNSENTGNDKNTGNSDNGKKTTNTIKTVTNAVKTGDTNQILLWTVLFVIACFGLAGVGIFIKKKK